MAVSEVEHVLVVVVHHIAGDGHSSSVAQDLIGAYGALWVAGLVPVWEPLAVQVADVALWEASVLGSVADEGRCWVGSWRFGVSGWLGCRSCWSCRLILCGRRWRRWWVAG